MDACDNIKLKVADGGSQMCLNIPTKQIGAFDKPIAQYFGLEKQESFVKKALGCNVQTI